MSDFELIGTDEYKNLSRFRTIKGPECLLHEQRRFEEVRSMKISGMEYMALIALALASIGMF